MNSSPDIAEVRSYRSSKRTVRTKHGFGLVLGIPLRERWVTPGATTVTLDLEGHRTLSVNLRKGFWNTCPEFVADEIYDWIISQKLPIPWDEGKPYRFIMERLSGTHFRVRRRV